MPDSHISSLLVCKRPYQRRLYRVYLLIVSYKYSSHSAYLPTGHKYGGMIYCISPKNNDDRHVVCLALVSMECCLLFYFSLLIFNSLHGFPAAIQSAGISFVTTLPAPIMERAPIVTPLSIILFAPIHTSSSMVIGRCL